MRRMSLPRVLEPEVMDSEMEAREYDAMDHAGVNAAFCADLLARRPSLDPALDVGTGTALIPIALCRSAPRARVVAVDLAQSMLTLGARNVERAGLSGAITLSLADAKALPYPDGTFGCVVSNSILHHIPDPGPAIAEMLRVLRPGGLLFARDLLRPPTEAAVAALVAAYAARETPSQRALFEASLRAAFTLDELRALAEARGMPPSAVAKTSDRHWTLAYEKPIADRAPAEAR
jgi:ubiquinone/menaquinone biosynthesis C-methylase UbiE